MLSKIIRTALSNDRGVRIYAKTVIFLHVLSFDTKLRITVRTEITTIITENARLFVSLNIYPKQAHSSSPAGYNAVRKNKMPIKADEVFFMFFHPFPVVRICKFYVIL